MAELQDYSTTAASNNAASPNGAPESMAPSGVNNTMRETMARIARERDDTQGVTATAGTANVQTFAAARDTAAAYTGEMIVFRAGATNTGAATITITPSGGAARGAVAIQNQGRALGGGEIVSGGVYAIVYDGTVWQLLNATQGWTQLDSATASASATIDVETGLGSGFDAYMLVLADILPATDNVNIRLRASTDGGSTFLAGATDYEYTLAELQAGVAGWSSLAGSVGATAVDLNSNGLGNVAGEQCSGVILIFNPDTFPRVVWDIDFWDDTATAIVTHAHGACSFVNGGTAVNALRILMSSGNITSGTITLYGLRRG